MAAVIQTSGTYPGFVLFDGTGQRLSDVSAGNEWIAPAWKNINVDNPIISVELQGSLANGTILTLVRRFQKRLNGGVSDSSVIYVRDFSASDMTPAFADTFCVYDPRVEYDFLVKSFVAGDTPYVRIR